MANRGKNAEETLLVIPKMSIHDLTHAMRDHVDSAAVQVAACQGLANVIYLLGAGRREAAQYGGCEAVLATLRRHKGDARVQEKGCELVMNLVFEQSDNQNTLAELGAAADVIAAMKKFPQDDFVQEMALGALKHLVTHNGNHQKRAFDADAVPAVAASLKKHLNSEAVAGAACDVMLELALKNQEVQDAAADTAILEGIIQAMRVHSHSDVVQDVGCGALQNLVYLHMPNQERAAASGAIDVIVDAMRTLPGNGTAMEHACGAMWAIVTGSEKIREQALAAGAVKALEGIHDNFKMTDRGWQKGAAAIEAVMDNMSGALEALVPGSIGPLKEHSMVAVEAEEMVREIRKNWVCRVTKARDRGAGVRAFSSFAHKPAVGVYNAYSSSASQNRSYCCIAGPLPLSRSLGGIARPATTFASVGSVSARRVLRVFRTLAH